MRQINSPERPAQLAVALSSPASAPISGQIFHSAGYELSIFSQPRPIQAYTRNGGWTAQDIIKDFFPLTQKDQTPLGWPKGPAPIEVPVKA
jgi:hypothetical protein